MRLIDVSLGEKLMNFICLHSGEYYGANLNLASITKHLLPLHHVLYTKPRTLRQDECVYIEQLQYDVLDCSFDFYDIFLPK